MLPNFVVAGTVRSGTTSLARQLGDHPDVFVAAEKEIHFFDRHYARGRAWYEEHFSPASGQRAVGEVTPNYLYEPLAIPRMAAMLPQARVIVTLRDPIDRAYSQYWMWRAREKEHLSFEDALAAEPDRLAQADDTGLNRSTYGYLDRSRYLPQLERMADHVPAERRLIIVHEEFQRDPAEVYAGLCRFLGVADDVRPDSLRERANAYRDFRSIRVREWTRRLGRHGRAGAELARAAGRLNGRTDPYPAMRADTRRELEEQFADHNAALAAWLGRDLAAWQRGAPR